ncbi:MAG: hypothetical protein H0W23_08510 [Chloroflexia bacterium]|nr:hypothetical protein [Chloroflexia bacterium]
MAKEGTSRGSGVDVAAVGHDHGESNEDGRREAWMIETMTDSSHPDVASLTTLR